ncbi:hypothetical protein PENSPDRAFT_615379 [Peniophora sp. CONT]|nr:hypothetical protein PENSPDRAFT_615379 [Peniophora sp. CONT]
MNARDIALEGSPPSYYSRQVERSAYPFPPKLAIPPPHMAHNSTHEDASLADSPTEDDQADEPTYKADSDSGPKSVSRWKAGVSLRTLHKRLGKLMQVGRTRPARHRTLDISQDEPTQLAERGCSLFEHFQRQDDLESLGHAIDAQQRALKLMHEGHTQKLSTLCGLGLSLWYRFNRLGEFCDIEDAIAAERLAVELTPEGHPERSIRLDNLAASLHSRFERLGDLRDIEDSITGGRLAVELTPVDHPERSIRLANLALYLCARYIRLDDIHDIEDAIAAGRLAVELTPEGHSERSMRLSNLALSLWSRFNRLGDIRDLEDMIVAERLVLDLTPEDHPDRPLRLDNLAASLHSRFERLGELRDIEDSITGGKLAVELTPEGHPERSRRLANLALSLWSRFNRLGEIRDIEDAIAAGRLAAELTPEGHSERSMRLSNLGTSLWSRFNRLGDIRDLEDAIAAERLVLDLTPEGHPDRPLRLDNLASSLWSRFERLGELRDIEDVITRRRLAIELTPEDHPERSVRLANLALSMWSRFNRLGEIRDIEDAIAAGKLAVERTPEGHPDRPFRLSNLAVSLHSRFEALGELRDLEDAITGRRLAVELTPVDHPERPRRLSNLTLSLWSRFNRLGEIRDIEDAITAGKLAVELSPEGHPDRPAQLDNLAVSLHSRFERLGEIRDIEDSITGKRLAIELMPEGHPDQSRRLYNLGMSLKALFKLVPSKVRFDTAFNTFMKATIPPLGNPTTRLHSAQECVSMLSEHPEFSSAESVLAAHSQIIQIFPEIMWLGHSIERRYKESAQLGTEVNAAISAFIRFHSRYQAIELMEAGRSLVWSQMFSFRVPLDDLEKVHPNLAAELRKISLELQRSGSVIPRSSTLHGHHHLAAEPLLTLPQLDSAHRAVPAADRYRQFALDYQDTLKNIRGQEGFEDFLRLPSITSLMPSIEALDGPVVFINVHSSSCDALALFPNGAVRHIALPDLTEAGARILHSTWTKLLVSSNVRSRGIVQLDTLVSDGRCTNMFGIVLWKIWIWIVRPILQALDFMKDTHPGRLPHITWCPTGPVTQLPLHAAGVYDFSQTARSQRVYNFVVSSYTPSLSALLRSREALSARPPPSRPNVLVVAQPATPMYAPLPHTLREGERVGSVITDSVPTLLVDKAATVERTIAAMRESNWVHMACHGYQDTENPTQSAFALVDGPLTLYALMGETADNAELAFLSACQTALGDEKNPEESVHLAAGMLAVGFKGVIATMWSIGDADAPLVVEAYYKKLLELRSSGDLAKGYTGAAYALHEAARVLREDVGEHNFVRWAPFVHFGV